MCVRRILQDRKRVCKRDSALWEKKHHFQPGPPEENFKKDMVFELDFTESSSLRPVEKEREYSRQRESRP